MEHKKAQIQARKSTTTLGDRLRLLRGEKTQEEFSSYLGISRAALANYETDRTKPKPQTLRLISETTDLPLSYFLVEEVEDVSQLASVLGLSKDFPKSLTKDEAALVRILRLCRSSSVKQIVDLLIKELVENKEARALADLATIEVDLARLITISDRQGVFDRGLTANNLDALINELRDRST